MTGLWLFSYIVLWLLFLIDALVLLSVLRNLGVIYESLKNITQSPPPPTTLVAGGALPNITLHTLSGDPATVSAFSGTTTAFSIVSPHCPACLGLLKEIAEAEMGADKYHSTVPDRIVISIGSSHETAELLRQVQMPQKVPVLIDTENNVMNTWGITGTPITVVVNDQMKVTKQVIGRSGIQTATLMTQGV